MSFTDLNAMLSVGGLLVVGLIQYAGIIYKIGKQEAKIDERIKIVEYEGLIDRQEIRKSILEAELKISREYLRNDAFKELVSGIDSRLIRLEGKLDTVISHNHQ